MNDQIKVKVTRHGKRKFLIMYYDDPITGKREQRSTKETTQRAAERAAAKWEAELREGRYKPASKITWAEFRQRYEDEVLPSLAAKTDKICGTVFRARVYRKMPSGAASKMPLSHRGSVSYAVCGSLACAWGKLWNSIGIAPTSSQWTLTGADPCSGSKHTWRRATAIGCCR
ncbi:MAG: hypothetical protein MPJ50_14900 [Pirellulales bacterium]|nr:hypothetical protein [Pirellulales bacterium]